MKSYEVSVYVVVETLCQVDAESPEDAKDMAKDWIRDQWEHFSDLQLIRVQSASVLPAEVAAWGIESVSAIEDAFDDNGYVLGVDGF